MTGFVGEIGGDGWIILRERAQWEERFQRINNVETALVELDLLSCVAQPELCHGKKIIFENLKKRFFFRMLFIYFARKYLFFMQNEGKFAVDGLYKPNLKIEFKRLKIRCKTLLNC